MKGSILLVVVMMIGAEASAECCPSRCDQPKPKVITRIKTVEKLVPVVVEKEVVKFVDRPVPVRVTQTVVKRVQKKNRVSVLGGAGPTRLSIASSEARLERGPVFGAQYQRMVTEGISVGVQVQSNETVLGSVGFDF